jgi:ornithine cyclodeaminase
MRIIDAAAVDSALSYPGLVNVLEAMFRTGAIAPPRHHHTIELDGRPEATLLLMPAWARAGSGSTSAGHYAGVKSVTVFPDAATYGKPAVQGIYLLFDTTSGAPLALIDAPALTAWRTAAASALAARHLARRDASRLLMVGAGTLAPYLIRAHASVRPIREILLWNRGRERAEALRAHLAGLGIAASIATDLEPAARSADIISTATLSSQPLIHGEWLKPGAHLDLVGGFRPTMREADDTAIRRSNVYVDTRAGAVKEAGDIFQPLQTGALSLEAIRGELAELASGTVASRTSSDEITLFKSVGAAIEDLAAAIEVYERTNR